MHQFKFGEKKRISTRTWDEFAEELIYKNRFSSKNDILEELHKNATDATHMIAKGTVLYRNPDF